MLMLHRLDRRSGCHCSHLFGQQWETAPALEIDVGWHGFSLHPYTVATFFGRVMRCRAHISASSCLIRILIISLHLHALQYIYLQHVTTITIIYFQKKFYCNNTFQKVRLTVHSHRSVQVAPPGFKRRKASLKTFLVRGSWEPAKKTWDIVKFCLFRDLIRKIILSALKHTKNEVLLKVVDGVFACSV